MDINNCQTVKGCFPRCLGGQKQLLSVKTITDDHLFNMIVLSYRTNRQKPAKENYSSTVTVSLYLFK